MKLLNLIAISIFAASLLLTGLFFVIGVHYVIYATVGPWWLLVAIIALASVVLVLTEVKWPRFTELLWEFKSSLR